MTDERSTRRGQLGEAGPALRVGDVPDGATNINVDGRRLTSPIQGFGKMWQKTYTVAVAGVARLAARS